MEEVYKLLIGIGVLALGFPIGMFLAKRTKEELRKGKKWFRIIIALGLLGGVAGLVLGDDALMFSSFFVAIVTSQSLLSKKSLGKKN